MPRKSVEQCLEVLGLPPSARPAQIQARFRRLVKDYHPDHSRDPKTVSRYIAIVQAYRTLQTAFRLRAAGVELRTCPRCGQAAELLDALDGRASCADCLLGATAMQRFLPLPITVTVLHTSVIACYAVSIWLAMRFCETKSLGWALASITAAVAGVVVLAATCLQIKQTR